ncbi:MAG: hypothetical protein KKB91_02735 [Proteobacteria bacterium]|nr:hypothetical protein [Desulfocapsa sp.]MBU3946510.1 hypothetical protein [Pseudomonadota bacterium]MCG2745300.1 hypothetical protein [Desulfobacteraceae bacterium]MBU3982058.1 hypothetical protein [Pseudomonadota bacterium]MBU4028436.1 hypothetical protein [Pseudomonadota bacterium]
MIHDTLSGRYMAFILLVILAVPHSANAAVHCVTKQGGGCDTSICVDCSLKIQDGIDKALNGDEVRVAAGTYSDRTTVSINVNGTNYPVTQVAVIKDKSLTLRGGYTTSNWSVSDPLANATIIDVKGYLIGAGRGITVRGNGTENVAIDGFTVQNGNYTNLGCAGNFGGGMDCGGGVYVFNSQIKLSNSIIRNNIGSTLNMCTGGGVFLYQTRVGSELNHVTVQGNECPTTAGYGIGGGIAVDSSLGLLSIANSIIQNNISHNDGGGLFLLNPGKLVWITDTRFVGNIASNDKGGGMYAMVTMDQSSGTALVMDRVRFDQNAGQSGTAIYLDHGGSDPSRVEINNLLLTRNQSSYTGPTASLIKIASYDDFNVFLRQLTVAGDNSSGSFLEAYAANYLGSVVHVQVQNALIDSVPIAFYGNNDTTAGVLNLEFSNTLIHNVPTLTQGDDGAGVNLDGSNTITADPLLDTTYHLKSGSPAINHGMVTNVSTDIDGDSRPAGGAYDIGADEYRFPWIMFNPAFIKHQ